MARRYINVRRWNTWHSDQPAILREVFTHKSKGIARRKSDRAQNDKHAYVHVARCDSFGGDNPIRQLLKSFKKQYSRRCQRDEGWDREGAPNKRSAGSYPHVTPLSDDLKYLATRLSIIPIIALVLTNNSVWELYLTLQFSCYDEIYPLFSSKIFYFKHFCYKNEISYF